MATDPADLCEVDDVKAQHRVVGATAAYDALIQRYITAASRAIANWSRREFAPAQSALTRRLGVLGSGLVFLEPFDLRSITQITHGEPPTTLPPEQYASGPQPGPEGLYPYLRVWSARDGDRSPAWVAITGDWGWPSIPADVREACVTVVDEWLTAAQAGEGPAPEALEGPAPAPNRALPAKARWLLEPYRRRLVCA